jgi:nitrogenase-associated protein
LIKGQKKMAHIIFWEKPGCVGNKKQKELLLATGHQLEVKNLLSEPWTKEKLRLFFNTIPVHDWFNKTNPQVKSGEINPAELSEEQALSLMLNEPLLIRRPLLQTGEECRCGFDVEQLNAWIGLDPKLIGDEDPQDCPHPENPCDK